MDTRVKSFRANSTDLEPISCARTSWILLAKHARSEFKTGSIHRTEQTKECIDGKRRQHGVIVRHSDAEKSRRFGNSHYSQFGVCMASSTPQISCIGGAADGDALTEVGMTNGVDFS